MDRKKVSLSPPSSALPLVSFAKQSANTLLHAEEISDQQLVQGSSNPPDIKASGRPTTQDLLQAISHRHHHSGLKSAVTISYYPSPELGMLNCIACSPPSLPPSPLEISRLKRKEKPSQAFVFLIYFSLCVCACLTLATDSSTLRSSCSTQAARYRADASSPGQRDRRPIRLR